MSQEQALNILKEVIEQVRMLPSEHRQVEQALMTLQKMVDAE